MQSGGNTNIAPRSFSGGSSTLKGGNFGGANVASQQATFLKNNFPSHDPGKKGALAGRNERYAPSSKSLRQRPRRCALLDTNKSFIHKNNITDKNLNHWTHNNGKWKNWNKNQANWNKNNWNKGNWNKHDWNQNWNPWWGWGGLGWWGIGWPYWSYGGWGFPFYGYNYYGYGSRLLRRPIWHA